MYLKTIAASVCLATGALLALPISARAITFSFTPPGTQPAGAGSFSTFEGATLLNDFDSTAAPVATYTGGVILNPANTTNNYAPAGDSTNFLNTGTYYTDGTFSNPQTAAPVQISFNTPVDYFGLYWGLIDSGNSLTVNTNTGSLTVSGSQVGGSGNTYVNFIADPGEIITSVVLQQPSDGNGFETDNHAFRAEAAAAAVPFELSPGLGSLLLAAWGVGIGVKRKLKNNPKLISQLLLK